jgi:peroxiredoxin family protein
MTKPGERLAFILNTASYERVAFALGVAAAAAAVGKNVCLLFGNCAVVRLKRGLTDEVGEETGGWIRGRIRSGIGKGSVSRISEMLADLKKLGAKVYACPAAMDLHNIVFDELVEEVDEVRSLVRFVSEDIENGAVIYV